MVVFPNCKINLGLHITGRRADGYHDIQTIFYPLNILDVLEIVQQDKPSGDIEFTSTGLPIEGDPSNNLCCKAYHLLKKDFPRLPSVRLHLHKHIPMGAGLGGGSADGAFTLRLLNDKFQLGLTPDALAGYALQLGSDCPFFIFNQPAFAEGRGEKLEPVPLDLSAYQLLVVNPGIHVNTGWAFSQVTPAPPKQSLKEIITQPVQSWKDQLINDFEAPVTAAHPQIRSIIEKLYAEGAVFAAMSGSGSTVFGIFPANAVLPVQHFADFKVFVA